MISEFLINIIFNILTTFLELLPEIEINLETSLFTGFLDFLSMVFYLFPMDTIMSILSIVVGLTIFRIVIAFIKTIWDLLPVV